MQWCGAVQYSAAQRSGQQRAAGRSQRRQRAQGAAQPQPQRHGPPAHLGVFNVVGVDLHQAWLLLDDRLNHVAVVVAVVADSCTAKHGIQAERRVGVAGLS